jgi:hypothetical protein
LLGASATCFVRTSPLPTRRTLLFPNALKTDPGSCGFYAGTMTLGKRAGHRLPEMQSSENSPWFAVVKLPFAAMQALSGNGRDTRYSGCWPKRML